MNTKLVQELNDMSDEELLDELLRPTEDLAYKLCINAIALKRILERLPKPPWSD